MGLFEKMMNEYYTKKLAEHGYVKVKGRYPYWAKMVGEEIVLIITYAPEMPNGSKPLQAFSLWGTVATVYRPKIDFEHSPKSQCSWMVDARRLYGGRVGNAYTAEEGSKRSFFQCNGADEQSIKIVCDKSYKVCEEEIVTKLDTIKTLSDVKEFYDNYLSSMLLMYNLRDNENYHKNYYCEALLLPMLFSKEEYEQMKWEEYDRYEKSCTEEELQKMRINEELEEHLNKKKKAFADIIEVFNSTKEKLTDIKAENKKNNYLILKKKGIIK